MAKTTGTFMLFIGALIGAAALYIPVGPALAGEIAEIVRATMKIGSVGAMAIGTLLTL